MIRNLSFKKQMAVSIVGCPTIREKDGLALSSRNLLLSLEKRKDAPIIYATLQDLNKNYLKSDVSLMSRYFKEKVEKSCLKVEYFFVA